MIPRTRPNFVITEVLASARVGREYGTECEAVESAVADRIGVRHVILTPSGRGALYLLLHCLPEGRVVIPGYTCSAVAEAAVLAGREVVYIEHISGGINLEPTDIDGRLKSGDIFILTHQYGYPANVELLCSAAHQCGAIVVEDVAAAFCGTWRGKALGSFGDAAFGSFDVSKLLHAPMKGGFVATNDVRLKKRLKQHAERLFVPMPVQHRAILTLKALLLCLVTHPLIYPMFHCLNFRLMGRATAEDGRLSTEKNGFYKWSFSNWQAWIVGRQFERLESILKSRAAIYSAFRAALDGHPVLRHEAIVPEVEGALARFPIYVDGDKMPIYQNFLKLGVDCGFSFTKLSTPDSLSASWGIAGSVLNLPYYSRLSEGDLHCVLNALHSSKENSCAG